ncbi:MAG TPA: rhodanese-like domain-containing protein [Myxococcota bacterium]|nr:rhodanese-like domain-containing protein [Myxococcota bacterium]
MGIRSTLKSIARRALGLDDSGPKRPPRPPREPRREASDEDYSNLANIECGAQELRERLEVGEHIVIVDVRTSAEVASGVLPGALHIELSQLRTRWEELKDADEIVCYCATGARSLEAATLLRQKGLINATSLEGGLGAWASAGGELGEL